MQPWASTSGWIRWAWLAGVLTLALAGPRPARASTCHVPDRPTLGLDRVGVVAPPLVHLDSTGSPAYRRVPCSDDPAVRPDHSSHLVGWFAAPVAGFRVPAAPIDSPPPPDPLRPDDRARRLDRPPRPA